ncbi:MAG: hypothetical protein WCJ66_18145 [Verrucomicrobiota bacterium]
MFGLRHTKGPRPPGRTSGGKRFGGPDGKIKFWILNAERALASLEKIGAAQTGMAEGNFKFWIGRELRAGAGAGGFVFHSKSIIQNSTLHGGRREEEILDFGF